METIAVISNKGGTGKTTLATHLAVEAEHAGETVALIDTDPQTSAANWGDHRQSKTIGVIATPANRLKYWLDTAAENGATFAIIDTAPHTETAALAAARAASLVLIPCKPSLLGLEAIEMTLDLVMIAKVPAQIVLNSVPASSRLGFEARQALENLKVPCAPCQIGQRVGFIHAYNHGSCVQEIQPNSQAAREIQALYAYIAERIGIKDERKKRTL